MKKEDAQVFIRDGRKYRALYMGSYISRGKVIRNHRGDAGTFEGIGRWGRLGDLKIVVDGVEKNAAAWDVEFERV